MRKKLKIVIIGTGTREETIPDSAAEHGLLSSSIAQETEISRREYRMVEQKENL